MTNRTTKTPPSPRQAASAQAENPGQKPAKPACPKAAKPKKVAQLPEIAPQSAPSVPHPAAVTAHHVHQSVELEDVKQAPQVEDAAGEQGEEQTQLSAAVLPESTVVADSLEHGQRVSAILATLFQDLAELHKLDDIWGYRLHLAAQLHDIGFAEGRKGHHKISMRIIEEDLSLNIQDEDRPWVALLARYHRKAWPSCRHARFAALKKREREELRKAASLLRIADALDYTHTGVVGQLGVEIKKHKVIITVQCAGDCSAEMQRVLKKGDLFMHVFGRELECICQEK